MKTTKMTLKSRTKEKQKTKSLNKMNTELNLQETMAEDLKHYLDFNSIFESETIGALKDDLRQVFIKNR